MKTFKRSLFLLLPAVTGVAHAQERYATKEGDITFVSDTPVEKIEAVNHKTVAIIDATTGAIEMSALIKSFEFEKALMQEHFNENYMESNTYPKAIFKGRMTGLKPEMLKTPGKHEVVVEGELTMHGVTRKVSTKGTIGMDAAGPVKAACDLVIKPEDYGIKIPTVVRGQIAEEVKVQVRISNFKKM
jgi:hypothetical protein